VTELRVSDAVCQGFPGLRIAAVVARSHILFVLETTESAAFGPAVDAAAADLAARAATRSRHVSTQWLTPVSPAVALGDPAT
jgi:hypothetical protein